MKKIYSNLNKAAFWLCLSFSICLMTASWFVPPRAVIDSSVLAGIGELFAFATLATVIEAISRGADITLSKGDASLSVDNPEKEEE